MSVTKFKADYEFGVNKEEDIKKALEEKGYTIGEALTSTAIHDISFSKGKQTYSGEIKSRRCTRGFYDDTMIGANKMEEAWGKYYKEGILPVFFFIFEDGTYFLNPFECIPRIEYRAGRWDRGIDKPKGWAYYSVANLININDI